MLPSVPKVKCVEIGCEDGLDIFRLIRENDRVEPDCCAFESWGHP